MATGVLPGPVPGGGAGLSTSSCGGSAPVVLPVDDGTGVIPADWELSVGLAEAVSALLDSSPTVALFGAYSAYNDCLMRSIEKLRTRLEELYDEKKEKERQASQDYANDITQCALAYRYGSCERDECFEEALQRYADTMDAIQDWYEAYTFGAIMEQNIEAIRCTMEQRNPGSLDDDLFWED
jgi:hypothetical protein